MKIKKLNKKTKYTVLFSLLFSLVFILWLHFEFNIMYYTHSYDLRRREWRAVHKLLRPSGDLGHGFGIIGVILVYVGLLYHIRKIHKKRLKKFLKVQTWLLIHIATSIVGGMLVVFHASALFENLSGSVTLILFLIALISGFLLTLFKYKPKTRKIIYWTHYYSTVLMMVSLSIHALYFLFIGFTWIF